MLNSPSAPGANSIRAYPALIRREITLTGLGVRVTTLGAGNVQLALYACDDASLAPTGAPLYSSSSQSTGSTGAVSVTGLSVAIDPGIYWFMTNSDNGTVVFTSRSTALSDTGELIGATAVTGVIGNNAPLTGFSKSHTFGTWPTLTGSLSTDSFSEVNGTNIPLVTFKA